MDRPDGHGDTEGFTDTLRLQPRGDPKEWDLLAEFTKPEALIQIHKKVRKKEKAAERLLKKRRVLHDGILPTSQHG